MKTLNYKLSTLLLIGVSSVLLGGGCASGSLTPIGNALAKMAEATAHSQVHRKLVANIPPNVITYEQWPSGDTNAPAN